MWGLALLVLAAAVSLFAFWVLVDAREASGQRSYSDIANYYYGTFGTALVNISLLLVLFGAGVIYIILIADNSMYLVKQFCEGDWCEQDFSHTGFMFWAMVLAFPLTLLEKLSALKSVSSAGLLCLLYLGCMVVVRCLQGTYSSSHVRVDPYDPELFPGSDSPDKHLAPAEHGLDYFIFDWNTFIAWPLFVGAFCGHFNTVDVCNELENPTKARQKLVMSGTIGLVTAMNVLMATAGYATFGENTAGNFLSNYKSGDVLIALGTAALTITVFCTYPLFVLPLRGTIFAIIKQIFPSAEAAFEEYDEIADKAEAGTLESKHDEHCDSSGYQQCPKKTCSKCKQPLPETAEEKQQRRQRRREKIAEQEAREEKEHEAAAAVPIKVHCAHLFWNLQDIDWKYWGVTLLINGLILLVAVEAGDFRKMLDLIGAVPGMLISFILPGMFGLQFYNRKDNPVKAFLCIVIICIGVFSGALGVYKTVA